MRSLALLLITAATGFCGSGVLESMHASQDSALSADPASPFWRDIRGVTATADSMGQVTPKHATEIRSRWTGRNLYFLFICPYEQLYLKPNPDSSSETNKLWDWDVAEAFLGSDFNNIRRYKEFELSPRGEWVDLDIDRDHPLPEGGWLWNSGFETKARIDRDKKIWYGEMRIPIQSVDPRPPQPGRELRANFYRMQGPPPDRKSIAWQPTNAKSYHVPEAFGILRLK